MGLDGEGRAGAVDGGAAADVYHGGERAGGQEDRSLKLAEPDKRVGLGGGHGGVDAGGGE